MTWFDITLFIISIILTSYLIKIYLNSKDKEWKYPKIKEGVPTKYGWVVRHLENFKMGKHTDIGFGTYIQAENGVEIGDNVQIGSHCSIYSRNTIDDTGGRIIIDKEVKIGAGTVILPINKCTLYIGRGTTIGALSLVKESIISNSIYVGVPAKPIKRKL